MNKNQTLLFIATDEQGLMKDYAETENEYKLRRNYAFNDLMKILGTKKKGQK